MASLRKSNRCEQEAQELDDQNKTAQRRSRSRKDNLRTKTSNPELQFETIIVKERKKTNAADRSEQIVQEVLRKPLKGKGKWVSKQSLKYIQDEFNDKIYQDAEVQSVVKKIAEERLRINTALQTFGMPEIEFKLGTPKEELMLMFSDRLHEHKLKSSTEREPVDTPASDELQNT